MSWAVALADFAAHAGERSSTAYRQLVTYLWDQGLLDIDAPAAVPGLIRVLAEPTMPEVKRARIALLLGLLAEGQDDRYAHGRAALVRAAVRHGIPRYLAILGDSTAPAARLALTYLLAHFHEDGTSILAHESVQKSAGTPAIARLERVLRFQDASGGDLIEHAKQLVPDATVQSDEARSQIRASILAPLGAEALFVIESSK
jgi:hypothetical protein